MSKEYAKKDQIIKKIRDYFDKREDVVMVFAFGSFVKNQQTAESDFDIAIYFDPKTRMLEWESESYYDSEDEMWGDVEKMIGQRTDLVVLNRAPAVLAYSIIQNGIPIIVKNRSLYLRFFLMVSYAAEYFRDFTEDFWVIKQRSSSLTEIDKNRLINILDFLESELKDYSKFSGINQLKYQSDVVLRRNVERWIENIVNSSIDIAKIILASEKNKIPQTYREIMQELSLIENFNHETADKLSSFAKLRNILAHEYLDVRFVQIKKFIEESEPLYQELSRFTKNFITSKSS